MLSAAYEEFGVAVPPLVDENHRLMAGEGRWLAAKKKGIEELPCLVVRGWSEKKKKRFMVSENRIGQLAGYDQQLYRAIIEQIKDDGVLAAIGFDQAALAPYLSEGELVKSLEAEWGGMPSFNQGDARAFRSIIVHFFDQKGVDEFAALIKQKISEKAKFVWYPQMIIKPWTKVRSTSGDKKSRAEKATAR
jgi:ParB-like chromosome segregation protein Spo0J